VQIPLFDALAHRDFRIWWVSFLVATSSARMLLFGTGWLLVLVATAEGAPERAALYLGLLGLSRAIPAILLGLIAGVVVDRVDRRIVLIASEFAFAATAFALGLAAITGTATLLIVLAAGAMYGATSVLYVPSRQAIQPSLVGDRDLPSAIGLNSIALSSSALIGPLVGGILVIPFGVGGVLVASGLGQLLVLAALTFLSPYPVVGDGKGSGIVRSLVEGLRYVGANALLVWLIVAYGTTLILVDPYVDLLPALARAMRFGPVELSWLIAAAGLGRLVAGLVVAMLRSLQRYPIVTFGAIALAGVLLAAFTRQRDLALLLVLAAGLGFTAIFAGSSISLIIQTTTPDHLRGRVNSLFNLLIDAGTPSGALALGILATAAGVDTALLGAGLLAAVVALSIGLRSAAAPVHVPAEVAGSPEVRSLR
jgi:predicted MFS family arabinose efflux permease